VGDYAIEFERVWKKFKKGEDFDSLRDLLPAMARRIFSRNHSDELRAREFWALNDFSFAVRKGEAVAIVGHNGSGKSTTLKLLSGILRPTRGTVKVEGRLSALIEVGAGFHQDLTGRENVYLNGTILGLSRKEIDADFDSIVDFAELHEFIDTPVKRYSSGMYARLGFSVAAHLRPDVLLVDEVLAVGDIAFQQKCVEFIHGLSRNGTTIVFISHNVRAAMEVCPRAILLDHGAMVMDGPAPEVVSAYLRRSADHSVSHSAQHDRSQIVVRKVAFLDDEDRETTSFQSGDRLKIRVALEALIRIPNPLIGLAFYGSDGTCIYGHNSEIDQWDVGDLAGSVEFEIGYECVHLYPGRYFVSLAIRDASHVSLYYLYEDKAYSFSIEGATDQGIGMIRWPHNWRRGPANESSAVFSRPR
jgi:lipopolysaccharide transport system ATP-binding protein